MTLNVTPTQVLAAVGVLLLVALVWRAGTRRARRAADVARASTRVVSLAGRVLVTAGALLGAQWLVLTNVDNVAVQVALLAVPDLLAAHVLTRALTVTDVGVTRRGGDRR